MPNFQLNVAVASAVRTAVGRAIKGTLRYTRPEDLAASAITEAIKRVPGLKAEQVEDVVLGCAMPEAEQGLNIARNAAFLAKLPASSAAETINRFCSSGLQAIVHGAQEVATGQCDVVVAGGVESMSSVPMGGNKISLHPKLAVEYPEGYIAMGHTAERVAKQFDVSREVQDQFALRSHQKAVAAQKAGKFNDEIIAVQARVFEAGKESTVTFAVDECPRPDTTLEGLAKLKPAFAAGGTVTPGNASPINDGAAATVLLSDAMLAKLGVKPIGRLRAYAVVGVPPEIMGIGPVPAIKKLLEKTGLSLNDIDLFEINEAFAAQAAYVSRELKLSDDRVNVNGGAIALGHPLGATGAKLTATLLYELKRRNGKYGIVSMCIGGGMGAAGLYERV